MPPRHQPDTAADMQRAIYTCHLMEDRCQRHTAAYNAGTLSTAAVLSAARPPARQICAQGSASATVGQSEPVTYLHSSVRPPISLQSFAELIVQHCPSGVEPHMLNAALVLMLRFEESTGLPLTELIMHRLFLACLIVAGKAHDDSYAGRRELSRATGVSVTELVDLETDICIALEWRLQVSGTEIALLPENVATTPPHTRLAVDDNDDAAEEKSPVTSMLDIVPPSCGSASGGDNSSAGWAATPMVSTASNPSDDSLSEAWIA